MRELGLPCVGINTSEAPALSKTYQNLRAELWFKVKAWLEQRDVRIPKNEHLLAELVSPRYKFSSSGKMIIESKDQMKKRGIASPDLADAVCLTFASNAATAGGQTGFANWKKPIKRQLKGIV